MKLIAITGGIACGKSTVAAWLPEWGGAVLDTDAVVHGLEGPGGEAVEPLLAAFGDELRDGAGGIDRRRLGSMVFADGDALARLNAIVHPLVAERMAAWLRRRTPAGTRFRAVLIPLLYEVGWSEPRWDAVVAVVCREQEQIRRLQARGLTAEEARERLSAQMACDEKARRADYVIRNDGDIAALRAATLAVVRALLENEP
ncbi:MAG: dephospho-CoA kinase [Kiritimatiellae bacterium]|nr:dephospho-CoA kinase [Kiritimatiellia bacterium]